MEIYPQKIILKEVVVHLIVSHSIYLIGGVVLGLLNLEKSYFESLRFNDRKVVRITFFLQENYEQLKSFFVK